MDSVITANNISKIYQNGDHPFYALKNVSISIPKGKLVILKGPSGSGKTTLLNILSSLDMPSEGEVIWDGVKLSDVGESEHEYLRRMKIGFVFQSVALIPIMNAYENVEFALRLTDKKKIDDARIKEVLKFVGMEERMMHMPGQMSGGEQQRIAIARAIVNHPMVLFADEPTAALDTKNGLSVIKLFKELVRSENTTVVMTTHDPNLMEMADELYELKDGEIIASRKDGPDHE